MKQQYTKTCPLALLLKKLRLANSNSFKPNHRNLNRGDKRLKVLPNLAEYQQTNFDAYGRYRVKEKEGEGVVMLVDPNNEELRKDIEERLNLGRQHLRNGGFNMEKTQRKIEEAEKPNIQQVKKAQKGHCFDPKLQERLYKQTVLRFYHTMVLKTIKK